MNHPPIPPNSEFFVTLNGKDFFTYEKDCIPGTSHLYCFPEVDHEIDANSTTRRAQFRTIIAAVAAEEWREIQIEARSRYSPNREISKAEYEKLLDECEHNINAWREWGREK